MNARAAKSIIRCSAGSKNKGLTFKLNNTHNPICWVDADFGGLFGREPPNSPTSVKSRCGHIVEFGGIPLIWKTQLTSEICASACHAECVGISHNKTHYCQISKTALPQRHFEQTVLEALHQPQTVGHHRFTGAQLSHHFWS